MCGFLLKLFICAMVMFKIFNTAAVIHVVTYGGQLLGAAIIGFLAVFLPICCRRFLSVTEYARLAAMLLLLLSVYLVVTFLPGYQLRNIQQFFGGIIFFGAISLLLDNYILNK